MGRSRTIGLVILHGECEGMNALNPFYANLMGEVTVAANRAGYSVLTSLQNKNNLDTSLAAQGLCDGYIVLGSRTQRECWRRFQSVRASGIPIIGWGDEASAITANFSAAYDACQHLISVGCNQIVCISSAPMDQNQFNDRIRGYRSCMETAGLPETTYCVEAGTDKIAQGMALAKMVLGRDKSPDGIFATCDLVAIGALKTLLMHGVSVPNDIAICGFDGIPATQITYPPLTTVEQDLPAIAERLVANFIALMAGEPPDVSPVSAMLVPRESTRKERAANVRVGR